MLWASAVGSSYYSIDVASVRYGDQTLDNRAPASTIIDSGTTFMYLPSAAFRPFLRALGSVQCERFERASAPADEFCARSRAPLATTDAGASSPSSAERRREEAAALDGCFSLLRVVLSEGGELSMRPSTYFYPSEAAGKWCVGVFDNYDEGLVLGTVNLLHTLVTFDRAAGRVGFLPTDCDAYAAPEPRTLGRRVLATTGTGAGTPSAHPEHVSAGTQGERMDRCEVDLPLQR